MPTKYQYTYLDGTNQRRMHTDSDNDHVLFLFPIFPLVTSGQNGAGGGRG